MNLKHLILKGKKRRIEKFGKKILVPLLISIFNLNSYSQAIDPPRSLNLIFEPLQEVTADQVGNFETDGILGSLPSGIDIKIKAEIEVVDTESLSKIYVALGSKQGKKDLLNTFVDFPAAINIASDKILIYEHIIVVELGVFPKPAFISCDVYLENKDALKSPVINYQTR